MNPIIKEMGEEIAYEAGTYTLDLTIPKGPKLKERGNYNLIWKKVENDNWKLKLIHIEDVTRLQDIGSIK